MLRDQHAGGRTSALAHKTNPCTGRIILIRTKITSQERKNLEIWFNNGYELRHSKLRRPHLSHRLVCGFSLDSMGYSNRSISYSPTVLKWVGRLKRASQKTSTNSGEPLCNEELNRAKGDLLANLASNEYFKAIDKRALDKQVISPVFKDEKNGTFKIISFFAKKARGTMARHIIQNQITTADGLLEFKEDGYAYNTALSKSDTPVFSRREQL